MAYQLPKFKIWTGDHGNPALTRIEMDGQELHGVGHISWHQNANQYFVLSLDFACDLEVVNDAFRTNVVLPGMPINNTGGS